MSEYTVRQGDTTASIALEHGFLWQTIWDHSNNQELRNRRDNHNVLNPGDVIFIPDRRERQESGATGQRHRFRRKGLPERLRLRLLDEDHQPRANLAYTLEIDGNQFSGTTDSEGLIEQAISPDARRGRLLVGESREEEHELNLGHLDPVTETSGVQARLMNLNYYVGEIDGEMNDETRMAVREFQRRHDLEETGEMNDETRTRLEERHGS